MTLEEMKRNPKLMKLFRKWKEHVMKHMLIGEKHLSIEEYYDIVITKGEMEVVPLFDKYLSILARKHL